MENLTDNKEYQVEYNQFKGPIYLLLKLVRKKKEDIYEIKLSVIIKDFIDYIRKDNDILLGSLSGFVYIASILLEIKSRSLIPSKRKHPDEEEDGAVEGDILRRREQEYIIFKKVSNYFRSSYEKQSLYYIREAPLEKEFLSVLPDFTMDDIGIDKLHKTALRLLKYREEKLKLEDIYSIDVNISVFDEMKRIKGILGKREKVTFREITSDYKQVIEKIISFLSILELFKKGVIDIIQFENFGSIIIKKIKF
ncbi:MAG: segregation/condensation protein A [Actinomycetota bacterium]|nr:segregation/condensation protein A [Actinomycetota bacterium]